ncbi:ABC transporter permease [Xylophilus sp. GOD-11R]|uniref:ABC transporter permease n=1 Tax=Xylophilus sp. GOD-11R TaxID=3089814 RepID=UPI00298C4E74|nr:FtsX-like permease family protein [Xylophilus sp. GOD-11R]WPB55262.1 FtsX-like permease family protein [Xylophilus sp. GOD-11R]
MNSLNSGANRTSRRFWQLGWRALRRDLRAGDLRLLIVAVTLAVAALTSVGFFSDRLQAGLARDAGQLLGGDVVVASDHAVPAAFADRARHEGLQASTSVTFPTMARATDAQGGASKLVALKAVDAAYPLRGNLRITSAQGTGEEVSRGAPAPGEIWVDRGLPAALDVKIGDTLLLGDKPFRIARLIVIEPDRGTGFLSFSPRVMLNAADLEATRLVQPASRLNWRFAVAGADTAAVARYARWATELATGPQGRGMRVESLETGRPEMRQTLDRAGKFLNLVSLLAALLSAVAVALAARGFAARHLDDCALLRVLGLSQKEIARSYTFEFALAGLFASALGVAIGFAVHYLFVALLSGLVETSLPAAGVRPAVLGVGMGMTLLLAFGLPPVLQLAQVPALRVIRRDVGGLKPASAGVLALGVAGFAGLLVVASRDLLLGLIAVGGFGAAVLLFAGLGWAAVKVLRRSVNENTAPRWLVLATRQISARPVYAVVQISSLSVGLLALVLLVLLRTDLIASWRAATPPNAPDRFVINVLPDQAEVFQQALRAAGVARYDWYPMVRGRLVAVNGKPVVSADYSEDRARRLVDREFNLSYATEEPTHNETVGGRWTPGEADAISVESGLAETLGLKLGDRLRFDIGGAQNEARITSLRKVDWGSMRANFFAMYPVARLPDDIAVTYLAAYRAPAEGAALDNRLVREFPNITSVDLGQTLTQIQRVLDQVIQAVEFLFGFTLAAGVIVLFAAVTATRDERAKEFAIMRALGAGSSLLRQVQRAELAGVGLLAGFLASAVAVAVGWALARYAFDFAWTASPLVPVQGALAGAALALAAGWWGLRGVLTRPVVETLRNAAD